MGLVNQGIRDTELADLKTICDKIEELTRYILKMSGQNLLPVGRLVTKSQNKGKSME